MDFGCLPFWRGTDGGAGGAGTTGGTGGGGDDGRIVVNGLDEDLCLVL